MRFCHYASFYEMAENGKSSIFLKKLLDKRTVPGILDKFIKTQRMFRTNSKRYR